jgi:hypothetical protein
MSLISTGSISLDSTFKLTLTMCLEIYFNSILKNLRGNQKLPVTTIQVAFCVNNTFIKKLCLSRCPVRILHAEVDSVATIDNSEQLVADARQAGKTNIDLVR